MGGNRPDKKVSVSRSFSTLNNYSLSNISEKMSYRWPSQNQNFKRRYDIFRHNSYNNNNNNNNSNEFRSTEITSYRSFASNISTENSDEWRKPTAAVVSAQVSTCTTSTSTCSTSSISSTSTSTFSSSISNSSSSLAEESVAGVIVSEANSTSSVVATSNTSNTTNSAVPAPTAPMDEATTFRHYRSRHWKSNYRQHAQKNEKRGPRLRHSYGVICRRAPRIKAGQVLALALEAEYLVQRRKHSIGLEEMVRSRWELSQVELIENLCSDMSDRERSEFGDIENFPRLWEEMCLDETVKHDFSSPTFLAALEKLKTLLNGYTLTLALPTIETTIDKFSSSSDESSSSSDESSSPPSPSSPMSPDYPISPSSPRSRSSSPQQDNQTDKIADAADNAVISWENICITRTVHYEKPPLGFPKGRWDRNSGESKPGCAMREVYEETGVNSSRYTILEGDPLNEEFTGINGYRYVYVYYLAKMHDIAGSNDSGISDELVIDPNNKQQSNEISELRWASYSDILNSIRPCDVGRIMAFKAAHAIFENSNSNSIASSSLS